MSQKTTQANEEENRTFILETDERKRVCNTRMWCETYERDITLDTLHVMTASLLSPLLRMWQSVLSHTQNECPYDRHALVEALLTHQRIWWETHLFDVAQAELARLPQNDQDTLRLYRVEEVRKVRDIMNASSPSPLITFLFGKRERFALDMRFVS